MKSRKVEKETVQVLVFSKWRRKGYSLFQTLKRVVVISVLATAYLLSVPVISLATETDTTEIKQQFDLDEIEVTAQRSPALYSQIARVLSVIEKKEIEASPAQSIQDLLEYVAGVDVRQRGAEGVQADVSIRGGTFDQTLILLNGINITDPQTGHHNLNLPVSLNQIERIEILEGPAGRVYGPNAFSGAINIVTRQPDSKLVQLQLSMGSFGFYDGNLFGSFNTKKLNHQVAFSGKTSKGYTENTDFGIYNLFYSNFFKTKRGKFDFQSGFAEKGFGANSFYTPKYPNQYEETKTLFSSAKWQSHGKYHFTPVIYWRHHRDRFELFRNNPASWYTTHNYHLTNTYGINLNSWVQWKSGKTAFGIEYRSENILSNVLGKELDIPQKVPGEDAEFTKSDSRNTISGFLEHSFYMNKLSFTAGLLGNYILESGPGVNIFPGVDMSYKINKYFKLIASYNTSLRMPTFTDLYYKGPTNVGNPDLKPEKSATLEGGLKWNSEIVKGQIVVFYRKGKDIIDWIKFEDDELWQPQNLTRLNSLGTEVQLQFNPQKYFRKNFPNKININYFYNNLQKEDANIISNYVLDNLTHKLVFSVNQSLHKNLSIELKANFQDREGTYTKFENDNWLGEVDYEPFWLFDGKLNYNRKGVNIYFSINNLFNKKYVDIGNVLQPGRWIKSGISYEINFQ